MTGLLGLWRLGGLKCDSGIGDAHAFDQSCWSGTDKVKKSLGRPFLISSSFWFFANGLSDPQNGLKGSRNRCSAFGILAHEAFPCYLIIKIHIKVTTG